MWRENLQVFFWLVMSLFASSNLRCLHLSSNLSCTLLFKQSPTGCYIPAIPENYLAVEFDFFKITIYDAIDYILERPFIKIIIHVLCRSVFTNDQVQITNTAYVKRHQTIMSLSIRVIPLSKEKYNFHHLFKAQPWSCGIPSWKNKNVLGRIMSVIF